MAENPRNNVPGGDQNTSEDQIYQNYGNNERQENDNQNLELEMAHVLLHPSPASQFPISPAVVPWTQQMQQIAQMQQIQQIQQVQQITQMQQTTQTQIQTQIQIKALEDQIQQLRAQMQNQQQHIEELQQALNTRNDYQMRDRASTECQQPSDLSENSPDSRPFQVTTTEDVTADGRIETETGEGIDQLESDNPPPPQPSTFLSLNGAPPTADATCYTAEPIIEKPLSIVEHKRAGEEEFGDRTAKRFRHTRVLGDIDIAETQRDEEIQTEDQASLGKSCQRQELTLPQPVDVDNDGQQRQQETSGRIHTDQAARQGPPVISNLSRNNQAVLQEGPPAT